MADPIIKFVESVCVQDCVYWSNPVPDGMGGYTYTPIDIKVRWDGKTKRVMDATGNEVVSNAEILVTQDVEVGGYLYLGTVAGLTAQEQANPKLLDEAYPIIRKDVTPLFQSSTEFVRTVYL
jgi:hypothetical protein